MKCTMIHSYPNEYYSLYSQDIKTFRQWNNEVTRMANLIMDNNIRNKFKGDMLEVFAELFFNLFQNDEGVGIRDYTPISINDDYGVDATGVNAAGSNSVIQVKYRSNPADIITYEEIAKTYTSALLQLHIDDVYQHDNTVFLFTNANGITHAFDSVMHKKVVLVNNSIICHKVDNNDSFWKSAYNMIFNALDA